MKSYAYVSFMNVDSIELTGALVTGYSLTKTKTPHDIVMLVGPNISANTIYLLSKYYNVERFDKNVGLNDIFNLKYDKLIYLDIDLIILNNIDNVFKEKAPATVPGIPGFLLIEPNNNINIDSYLKQASKLSIVYNYQFNITYMKSKIYTINDIFVINFPDEFEPWNQLILDHFVDESEANILELYGKYYKLWLNIYEKIKYKYKSIGLNIDF